MDVGKPGINVNSSVQGFVVGDGPVTNNFYDSTGRFGWSTRLTLAGELRPENFKLGDSAAARFPYVITPIQDTYDKAIQSLQDARAETGNAKRGILVLGESNSGKTRLALEVLRKVLPDWSVLRWRPDYTIGNASPVEFLSEKPLVLLIDNLQDYASTQISKLDGRTLIRKIIPRRMRNSLKKH